jgi:ATP adenylyltransferase
VTELSALTAEEAAAVFGLVARTVDLLRGTMRADAVNLGANLGQHAGGSIDHLHLHCVPRWAGDTNFMPVVAETKVLVEMLGETWRRISEAARVWDAAPPAAGG